MGVALLVVLVTGCAGAPVSRTPGPEPVVVAAPPENAASPALPLPPLPLVTAAFPPPAPGRAVAGPPEPRAPEAYAPVPTAPAPPAEVAVLPAAPLPPEQPTTLAVPPAPTGWQVPERPEIDAVLAEFTGPRRHTLERVLAQGERYLPLIRRELAAAALPPELAYLPLVESHYDAAAESPAGALGLWQFIDTTARGAGLRVDWWVDERLDPELATRAAARHLQELYVRFGDWELALAAYNAGPGGVAGAQARSGADDFWTLAAGGWLRAETRRYLPKFYAAVKIAAAPERYGFSPVAGAAPLTYDTVPVAAPVDLYTVARLGRLQVGELQRLNPALQRRCTPPGATAYPLRVPLGQGARVAAVLDTLAPGERTDFLRYRVVAGDSLWTIARRFATRPGAIAELNGVTDPRRLRLGQQLVVPTGRGGKGLKPQGAVADRTAEPGGYRVQPGDTVGAIARRYGVPMADLLRWNGLGHQGLIRVGDRLFVGAAGAPPQGRLAGDRRHVVESGDTLWGIARRYGVPLEALRRANALEVDAVLQPGDELVVGG